MESTNNCPQQSPLVSSSTHSTSPLLKKTSPLKHVTPIIKKYDCQRQAKNGKSAKLKTPGKVPDEESSISNPAAVHDLVAGMDSLDAALRRAEKCIAGGKDHDSQTDYSLDHVMEAMADDLGDMEEEGISSSLAASNQQNAVSNRSAHLRRNRVLKKRNQLQKDLDHALPLAEPDQSTISEERSYVYAASYFQKVRDRFETKNRPVFESFMQLMEDLNRTHSVTDLYHRIIALFEGHPDLSEEFLLFLWPKQAIQCGNFMEHLAVSEMSSFLRKLELCFAKQPQHLKKIHASWSRLADTSDVTLETVRSTILPLLRGNTFLVDSFLELFPSEKPPESKMTDFDHVVCDDNDSEHSGDEEPFERVEIPSEIDDPYGGENCQCCCHLSSDSAFNNRTSHCTACGIKFISGKVFMHTEHGLRPVRIDFSSGSVGSNIKRLKANHQKLSRPRSRRGRTSQMAGKSEDSKQTVETDDESAFAKVKSPRQRLKTLKIVCEKVSLSKPLSLSRSGCSRKLAGGKMGTSPVPLLSDQETMAALGVSEDEKPPMDQDSSEKESYNTMINADHMECSVVLDRMTVNDHIKQEEKDAGCFHKENNESRIWIKEKDEIDIDVKSEESASEDFPKNELLRESIGIPSESDVSISAASSDCEMTEPRDDGEAATWTRDEDRTILCTFQSEPDKGKILEKINVQLPHRTIDEINNRFKTLMDLIQQMR